MGKKIAVITGANAGIGREATALLMRAGFHVVLACRNTAAAQEVLAENSAYSGEVLKIDMGVLESVRAAGAELVRKFGSIDVLIHNAAIFSITQKERQVTMEGRETVWATNFLGPVLLTELLLENLKSARARIITISSKGLLAMPFLRVSLDDPEFGKRKYSVVKAYYQSKLALMMYTQHLAERLSGSGASANCIRVPAVQIDISRHPELSPFIKKVYELKSRKSITPAQMAQTYLWMAASEEAGNLNGAYVTEKNRLVPFGRYASDPATIAATVRLAGRYIPELEGRV